jgi:hypothetical protein
MVRLSRRLALGTLGLGVASGALAGAASVRLALGAGTGGPLAGQWTPLGELAWQWASTGWLGVANQHRPRLDQSFVGRPLAIGGIGFGRGIGTYPLSELAYRLDGQFSRFTARVGVDDATPPGPNALRFLVFLDDVLRYESEPRRAGDPPLAVDLVLNGAETLRLVAADLREDEGLLYADWAEPMLLRPVLGRPLTDALWERRVRDELTARASARARSERDLAALSAAYLAALEPRLGAADAPTVSAAADPAAGWLALGNRHLIVALGLDGAWRGQLLLLDRRARRLVLERFSPAIAPADAPGPTLRLDADAGPGTAAVAAVEDPALGRGRRLEAAYPLSDARGAVVVRLTLYDDQPYLVYQLALRGDRAGSAARFALLDGTTALGSGAQYLTDFSRLRHGRVHDDGITRRESVGPGKPTFLWSDETDRGLLLAALDEAPGATTLAVRRDPGAVAGSLRLEVGARRGEAASPRLYVEVTPSVDPRRTHASFKQISARLHPPAPLPDWVGHQWISWYAFNVEIDEAKLRRQVDYIAENLADLGPWHVLIDAGWYVAEGRPGAGWRSVDRAKFPAGLRPLVDYAHSRGVRVMGYVSVPYLDSRERPGDWLGLGELIARHREWLVELGGDQTRQSYAFDFTKAEVRDYWRSVVHDLLVECDMDALKVDGLGNAEGALLSPGGVDAFGRVDAVADQALDIYQFFHAEATRLKPDVYLQAGWLTPTLANPYCHAFWYGDDYPAFSNPYPFPGLREKLDYATVSARLLGQRQNMGNVYDGPNRSTINRWWLGAGLALNTQVALSFDLTHLSAEGLASYRALLAHSRPFRGQARFGPGIFPDYFATTLDGTTCLGVVNRAAAARTIVPALGDLGLDPTAEHAVYDVEDDRSFSARGDFPVAIEAESFRLYILRRDPGVLWTTSAVRVSARLGGMTLELSGPAAARGRLVLASPEPRSVALDGRRLPRRDPDDRARGYGYDRQAGVLDLRYTHRRPRRLEIAFDRPDG